MCLVQGLVRDFGRIYTQKLVLFLSESLFGVFFIISISCNCSELCPLQANKTIGVLSEFRPSRKAQTKTCYQTERCKRSGNSLSTIPFFQVVILLQYIPAFCHTCFLSLSSASRQLLFIFIFMHEGWSVRSYLVIIRTRICVFTLDTF